MDTPVCGEFGMKSSSQNPALTNQHRGTIAEGQHLDAGAGGDDARGANEDHLQRATGEFGFRRQDGRVDLAAIGVAFNDCIEQPQGALWRIEYFARQQDGSGAGAKDGVASAKLLQSFKEARLQEFEDGGRFAAGQDESIETCQLVRLAHLARLGSGFGERFGVGGIVALDGEYANAGVLRSVKALSLLLTRGIFFSSEPLYK